MDRAAPGHSPGEQQEIPLKLATNFLYFIGSDGAISPLHIQTEAMEIGWIWLTSIIQGAHVQLKWVWVNI